jgi:uncharacterized protein (TIGR01777 family)
MGTSVLITGGSGLIGSHLTARLLTEGFIVSHLSRTGIPVKGVSVYKWNPEMKMIDSDALKKANYIIHLAGTNIGEKRWTKKRKEEIVRSRVDSSVFLFDSVKNQSADLKAFISASATGYYGSSTSDKIYTENDPPATDFLATTCRQWEESADLFSSFGIRTVKIRSSMVLEKTSLALLKLLKPVKMGFIIRLGNGLQYMPWIHIEDLCGIYIKAIKDLNMDGAYNAVSTDNTNQISFMKSLSEINNRFNFMIPVPSIILKVVIGEMSKIVLEGSRISSQKIVNAGYRFVYPDLEGALNDILMKKK